MHRIHLRVLLRCCKRWQTTCWMRSWWGLPCGNQRGDTLGDVMHDLNGHLHGMG